MVAMYGRIRSFFENAVIIAIILVLIQTFLEDLSLLLAWDWTLRKSLLIAGFGFDLFFTIEFLIRFFAAFSQGRANEYFLHRKGWIDFFASIPLLLFNSGPMMAALYFGGSSIAGLGGVFNILKVAKAVRIARVLRLLRVLKIFKQIKHTGSVMAQRHVSLITTLSITVTVATIFGASFLQQAFSAAPGVSSVMQQTEAALLDEAGGAPERELGKIADQLPSLLIVKKEGATLYSRHGNEYYQRHFGPMDYRYVGDGEYGFYLSNKAQLADQAAQSMTFFILIVLLVLSFLLYYSPHFALTVSDPVQVMRRGVNEPGYNLEVRIPERYASDEIFRLAEGYNRKFLPLKDRQKEEEQSLHSELSLDTIKGIFDGKG